MIAISYRREDTLAVTGRLYDRLQAKFGKRNVFMDFDSIRPGLDFREQIKQTIEGSRVVVAVIGPHWLGEQPDAARRIDDPTDFVRLEIAYALNRGIPVIPVLVNNTPMPNVGKLPADIQALAFRHALPLDSGLDFHQHADRLISGIANSLDVLPAPPEQGETGEPVAVATGSRKKLVVTGVLLLLSMAAFATWLVLRSTNQTRDQSAAHPINPVAPARSPVALNSVTEQAVAVAPTTAPRMNPVIELSSVPPGAKVLQKGVLIGTTPLRRDDLPPGDTTFLLVHDGYLPHALKAALEAKQEFRQEIALAQPAPVYTGTIRVRPDDRSPPRPVVIALHPDLKTGHMTQSSRRGDFVVKFTGVWEETELHAVTGDVVSQPAGIQWAPESFILRFGEDGKTASYECAADGKTYAADLSAPSVPAASTYRGSIHQEGDQGGAGVPLTIKFAADRKSGTETQSSKHGDTVVKFNGVWDGQTLRVVTDEVVAKPRNIEWKPESFTLRFADDWKTAAYECHAEGHVFRAELSAP